MTADTDVRSQLSDDFSSKPPQLSDPKPAAPVDLHLDQEDLPKLSPAPIPASADCNGGTKNHSDVDVTINGNGIMMDDPDGSYVFVNGGPTTTTTTYDLTAAAPAADHNQDLILNLNANKESSHPDFPPNHLHKEEEESSKDPINREIVLPPVHENHCVVVDHDNETDIAPTSIESVALPPEEEEEEDQREDSLSQGGKLSGAVSFEIAPADTVVESPTLEVENHIASGSTSDPTDNQEFVAMVTNNTAADLGASEGYTFMELGPVDSHCASAQSVDQSNLNANVELGKSGNAELVATGCEHSEAEVEEIKCGEQSDLHNTEVVESEQHHKSEIVDLEVVGFGSSKVKVGEVNCDNQTRLDSNTELGQSQKSENVDLEMVEFGSLKFEVGEVKCDDQTRLESNLELGQGQKSENADLEAAGCESPEVEVGKVKCEEHSDLQLIAEELEPCKKSANVHLEAVGCESPELEVSDDKFEVQTQSELATEVEESQDAQIVTTETIYPLSNQLENGMDKLHNGEEKLGVENSTDLVIDGLGGEPEENMDPHTILTESVESGSYQCDSGVETLVMKDKTYLDSNVDKNQEYEIEPDCRVQSGLIHECKAAELTTETHAALDMQTVRDSQGPTISIDSSPKCAEPTENPQNPESFPISGDFVISEDETMTVAVESDGTFTGGLDEGNKLEDNLGYESYLVAENLPNGVADAPKPENVTENLDVEIRESIVSSDNAQPKIVVTYGLVGGNEKSGCPTQSVSLENQIGFDLTNPEEEVPVSQSDDVHMEFKVLNRVEFAHNPSVPDKDLESEYNVYDEIHNGATAGRNLECDGENSSAINIIDMASNYGKVPEDNSNIEGVGDEIDGGIKNKPVCLATKVSVAVQSDRIPTSLTDSDDLDNRESELKPIPEIVEVEGGEQVSGGDGGTGDKPISQSIDSTEGTDVNRILTSLPESSDADAEAVTRPFHFLIRIPRFDDEKLRERIRHAQIQVEEKTEKRHAIGLEIQIKRGKCRAHGQMFEAAKSEERSARKLVKSKRQDIDSVQSEINRMENARSVEGIDGSIYNMEHMIQHETLPLKEEKQFIREIKRLKHIREQLSSNMGSQDEVQKALAQRDHNEALLKNLKKELDYLKGIVSIAQAAAITAGKKYDDECKKLNELNDQYEAANAIRQEAYAQLRSLKNQLFEKNKHFRMYKGNATASSDYSSSKDRVGLHHLCVNQVETIMELWNQNDEFRKEYVRCNIRSTLRRFKTLDGRSLGVDEEPPVLPSYVDDRVDRFVSSPAKEKSMSLVSTLEQGNQLSAVNVKEADNRFVEKVTEQNKQAAELKRNDIPDLVARSSIALDGSGSEKPREEEINMPTKGELELVRKAEELRKEEVAAKLKEQRRLEEKTKAQEALERKKRNAEKAQIRAELRAQREAEQKEKEKEKRLRKKERKKGAGADGNSNDGETSDLTPEIPPSEVVNESSDVKESPSTSMTTTKRPAKSSHYVSKQSKPKSSIPPPLRNRGKRRIQQWIWLIVAAVFVLTLFLLGNSGFFLNLQQRRSAGL